MALVSCKESKFFGLKKLAPLYDHMDRGLVCYVFFLESSSFCNLSWRLHALLCGCPVKQNVQLCSEVHLHCVYVMKN